MTYESPQVRELGTVRDLTLQNFNKIGSNADTLDNAQNNIVGSFVPVP